jgi:hypothetical protein
MIFSSQIANCCCPNGGPGPECEGFACCNICTDSNCDGLVECRCIDINKEDCEDFSCSEAFSCNFVYNDDGIQVITPCQNCSSSTVTSNFCNCEDDEEWPTRTYFPHKCVNCKYYEDAFEEDSLLSSIELCARASFQITSGTDFGAPVFDINQGWTWIGGTGGYGGLGIDNRIGKTPCPEIHPDFEELHLALVEYCGCSDCNYPPLPLQGSNESTAIGVNLCSSE